MNGRNRRVCLRSLICYLVLVLTAACGPATTESRLTPEREAPATATSTPASYCLAVQGDLWETEPRVFAAFQEEHPDCSAVPVEGREQAMELLERGRSRLAIVSGEHPEGDSVLLRTEAFVLAGHVASPGGGISLEEVRESFSDGGRWLPVVVGDGLVARELLLLDRLAPTILRASSWVEAKELVMANKGLMTLLPWKLVDFTVRAVMVEGQPAISERVEVSVFERYWWLVGETRERPAPWADLRGQLAHETEPLVSLLAVGDVMLGRGIANLMEANSSSYPFLLGGDLTREADVTFGNLECAITARGTCQGGFALRAGPEAASALAEAGFDVMSLANNHADDCGATGLSDTVRYLQEQGIACVGLSLGDEARGGTVVLERQGLRMAFLAFNHVGPQYLEGVGGPNWLDPQGVCDEVRRATEEADFVVVSLHWGREYFPQPDDFQREVAREIVNAGAGLVLGHHPHVVGAVAFEEQGLVVYSLGNYVFDQPFSLETLQGLAVWALIGEGGLKQVTFLPVQIVAGQPAFLPRAESSAVLANLFEASETMAGLPSTPEDKVDLLGPNGDLEVEWALSLSGQVRALRLHDLHGDARAEIVVATGSTGGPNCVHIAGGDGSARWQYCVEDQINDLECGDLDGDGRAEVVLATGLLDRAGEVLALDGEGRLLWRSGVEASVLDLALGSVDGDNTVEVAAGEWGAFGDTVYLLGGKGDLLWKRPTRGSVHSVAVVDLDGDGAGDVLAGAEDLYVLNGAGTLLGKHPTAGYVVQVAPADLDETGVGHVVAAVGYPAAAVSALDGNGAVAWRHELEASPTVVLVADVHAQDGEEVLVGALDGSAYLFGGDGRLHWRRRLSDPVSDLTVGDVNGDGLQELVVGTGDYLSPGAVWVLDGKEGAVLSSYQGLATTTLVKLNDRADGDGLSIVAASGNEVYSLRWAGSSRS